MSPPNRPRTKTKNCYCFRIPLPPQRTALRPLRQTRYASDSFSVTVIPQEPGRIGKERTLAQTVNRPPTQRRRAASTAERKDVRGQADGSSFVARAQGGSVP